MYQPFPQFGYTDMNWLLNLIRVVDNFIASLEKEWENRNMEPDTVNAPASPTEVTQSVPNNPDTLLPWEYGVVGSENNRHNVRVLCDLGGLSYTPTQKVRMVDGTIQEWSQKDILTACVRVESDFDTDAKNANPHSTDWGICQYNDAPQNGWIGEGCVFPSVQYVLQNPEADVKKMVAYYRQTGNLSPWVSFTSGAFRQYLGKV